LIGVDGRDWNPVPILIIPTAAYHYAQGRIDTYFPLRVMFFVGINVPFVMTTMAKSSLDNLRQHCFNWIWRWSSSPSGASTSRL
jgi:hypothetical protein